MAFKVKITRDQITYGDQNPDPKEAWRIATELMEKGYRRTSNAYCHVSRIDRDDWVEVLARERRCSVAHFYNVDGSGISDSHRDHYVRCFSKDTHTVAPEVIRFVKGWW